MFLLYLDASGTPQLNDSTKHYVLVGAAVHENTWFALNKRIKGLKRRYAYPGEDFELHVMDFYTLIPEQSQIQNFEQMNHADRRWNVRKIRDNMIRQLPTTSEADGHRRERLLKRHRRTDPFVHLTRDERTALYEDALDLIGGHNGLVLFGEAIEKRHPAIMQGVDCVRQAFEQVITRFDAYLHRKAAWRRLSTSRLIQGNKGLIVMDRDREKEAVIERQFADYRNQGHPWGQLEYVIDAPFFVDSDKFPGVQIVDVCAYATRRYLDKGAITNSLEGRQFLKIFGLFDRDLGHLHGLRHYTQTGTCACSICRERGHDAITRSPLIQPAHTAKPPQPPATKAGTVEPPDATPSATTVNSQEKLRALRRDISP
jgi:hypothetical protein